MDGVTLKITPLTLIQVENWLKAEPLDTSKPLTLSERLTPHFRDVICPSLNNALATDAPEDQRWTPQRCCAEMDQLLALKLYGDILELSGYKVIEGDAKREGEPQGISTSQPSDGSLQGNAVGT